jgi:hypothetical protein
MYAPGMESIPKRFKKAISRWVLFFFFWIVALVALPVGWVGVSFAVWFAWMTIKLKNTMKEMNQQVELTAR